MKPGEVEEVVAIGTRPLAGRLAWQWLAAAGVALGTGGTVAVVRHYDATHPDAHKPSAAEIVAAVQSTRPRLGR